MVQFSLPQNSKILKGQYFKDKVYKTHSPSMDIQVSSNFERLLHDIYDNPKIVIKQMEKLNSEDWEKTLKINVISHFYFNKLAIPMLKKNKT